MIKVSSSLIRPRWLSLIIYGPYYHAALAAQFNLLPGVNNHFLLLIPPHYRSAEVTMFSDKTTLFQKRKTVKSKKKEWVFF